MAASLKIDHPIVAGMKIAREAAKRNAPHRGSPWDRRRPAAIHLCIALALFALSAQPIDPNHVPALEVELFRAVNTLPALLFIPIWTLMQFGQLLAVPATMIAALLTRRIRLAVDLGSAGVAAYVLAKVVKEAIPRARPGELIENLILRSAPGVGNGYVAGHAATAVALATVASPYLGKRSRIIAWIIAGVVCLGRIYVGAHLPLDVAGGAALGWAIGSLVHTILGPPSSRRVVMRRQPASSP